MGFRQFVSLIQIDSVAVDGVQALKDIQAITNRGPVDSYSFNPLYYNYETYVVFFEETALTVCIALIAVFVVILSVTANVHVTFFVLLCVVLVDVFLFALLAAWDVTMNSISIINIILAIGLAVDYSCHIGHAYLMVKPPEVDDDGVSLSNY